MSVKSDEVRFSEPNIQSASDILKNVIQTGKLGNGRAEFPFSDKRCKKTIAETFPWRIVLGQLIWSSIVILIAFLTSTSNASQLSNEYWESITIGVSPIVFNGIGLALFVLLGFYISEANRLHVDAQFALNNVRASLRRIVRFIRQCYPAGSWHENDHDRIFSHLVSFPIALKMTLRAEREKDQLRHFLCSEDAEDVITSRSFHLHCLRVVRAYIDTADDKPEHLRPITDDVRPKPGFIGEYLIMDMDELEMAANVTTRIKRSRPAFGYINHLRIFLYIWIVFLPLALVRTSGWFTVLWSLLITYGVSMLLVIADSLQDPYGFKHTDIRLNRICAEISRDILIDSFHTRMVGKDIMDFDASPPSWLSDTDSSQSSFSTPSKTPSKSNRFSKICGFLKARRAVLLGLLVIIIWSSIVLLMSYVLRQNSSDKSTRWWPVYIPLDTSTLSNISMVVFLVLAFWMNESYGRYWRAIQIWQSEIIPMTEHFAFNIAASSKPDIWHPNDISRVLSHLAALPFTIMLKLRDSRNVDILKDLLSSKDLLLLSQAPDMPSHILNVFQGYVSSIGQNHIATKPTIQFPLAWTYIVIQKNLPGFEDQIANCDSLKRFPISPTYTLHLQLFVWIWIFLLPFSLVLYNGFLTYIFIVVIGFSILNLMAVGRDLLDPFGYDADDLPLETFCEETKYKIQEICELTHENMLQYIRESNYDQNRFVPSSSSFASSSLSSISSQDTISSAWDETAKYDEKKSFMEEIRNAVRNIFRQFPSVNYRIQLFVVFWSVAAVLASYGLSNLWPGAKQEDCREWCSPIDVDGAVLGDVGFALFFILAFRAADGIKRYSDGSKALHNLFERLRTFALEASYGFESNTAHNYDKQRIIAHVAQIPLSFRDMLLGRDSGKGIDEYDERSLLSREDFALLQQSSDRVEHLIRTTNAYFVSADMPNVSVVNPFEPVLPPTNAIALFIHIKQIRQLVSTVLSLKKFPVIHGYRRHQYFLMCIWLGLLPFTMTQQTGFFTILWAPLISYGVLGLEEIAIKLVDPFGLDSVNLPIEKLCTEASSSIIEAVNSAGWECMKHTSSDADYTENEGLGMKIVENQAQYEFSLFSSKAGQNEINGTPWTSSFPIPFTFDSKKRMASKSMFNHIMRCTPWLSIVFVTSWTVFACMLSYVTRNKEPEEIPRWWESFISVDQQVTSYLSVGLLSLLGFYVRAAKQRYCLAGRVWSDSLRSNCHSLTAMFLSYFPSEAIHVEDHRRIVGHIAAIPLVLKQELRNSRDVRELKGLVSQTDFNRISCAPVMTLHCIDVLRAYFFRIFMRKNTIGVQFVSGGLDFCVRRLLDFLDKDVQTLLSLNEFALAPGLLSLLNVLVGIWFIILPFVLAEICGWFTVLCVPIIAYGLLGLKNVAAELEHPFGQDVNDYNLDAISKEITNDIINAYCLQPRGCDTLVRHNLSTSEIWSKKTNFDEHEGNSVDEEQKTIEERKLFPYEKLSKREFLEQSVKTALHAFPPCIFISILCWSILAVSASYLMAWYFPISGEICESWLLCSPISIDTNVSEYYGFTLFLLLGFRLEDSHSRFVLGLREWQEGILGYIRILSNQVFTAYRTEQFHERDMERIAGMLSAHAVCQMSALRRKESYYWDKPSESLLRRVLGAEDAIEVMNATDGADYCTDVIRAYFTKAKRFGSQTSYSGWGLAWLYENLDMLTRTAPTNKAIIRTPMPFGYIRHVELFMGLWILLLPFVLVESSGWLSILWSTLISYGVVGIEFWARELADPFKHDFSDIPIEKICEWVMEEVKDSLNTYRLGVPFLKPERKSFPTNESKKKFCERCSDNFV